MTDERVKIPPEAVDRLRSLFASAERASIAAEHYAAGVMAIAAPGRRLAGIDDASDELLLAEEDQQPS